MRSRMNDEDMEAMGFSKSPTAIRETWQKGSILIVKCGGHLPWCPYSRARNNWLLNNNARKRSARCFLTPVAAARAALAAWSEA